MTERDDFEHAHVLPENAGAVLRASLGLAPDAELRIAFFGGPGDVVGTFRQWRSGENEHRTPVIAYSEMFYSLASALDAHALILSEQAPLDDLAHPGFTFQHLPRPRPKGRLAYLRAERQFARCAARKLEAFKPHVAVLGGDAPNALLNRIDPGVRAVISVHNAYWTMGRRPSDLKSRIKLALKARAFRRLHGAVCTSEECARQARSLGVPEERCIAEIPQILRRYAGPPDQDACTTGQVERLLFLGRIEREKGVFDLLHAFHALADETPGLTLDLAGTGSVSAELERAIAESPHSQRITYHGLLEAERVHDLLKGSDLLVCPTRDSKGFIEGLALVVAEAALHGVPSVVSTAVPARDLVPGGCAIFPANDAGKLTDTLRRLVRDPADYARKVETLRASRHRFFDRSLSWSSVLFRVIC